MNIYYLRQAAVKVQTHHVKGLSIYTRNELIIDEPLVPLVSRELSIV